MLRVLLINPLAAGVTLTLGLILCRCLGIDPHLQKMTIALAITVTASELASIPLLVRRNAGQLAMSQAALIAMVIHLLLVAGAMTMMPFNRPFSLWLGALFGATLISLSATSILCLRAAAAHSSPDLANTSNA